MEISILNVLESLAHDVRLDPFTKAYVIRRYKSEGIRFLTVTLPKLSKAVIASLEKGSFDRPTDFAWKGRSLLYFRSLLRRIFCVNTGVVLDDVDSDSLLRLRQFCEYFYKLALEFDEQDIKDAEAAFVETEAAVRQLDCEYSEQLRKDFETYYKPLSSAVVSEVFRDYRPRSGPGTWSGMSPQQRYYRVRTTDRYTRGVSGEFSAYSGYFKEYPGSPNTPIITDDTSLTSEVLFVPKDSRGPRTIVREPYFRLKAQLAFFDWFASGLERVSHKRINFYDQAINRELARASSVSKAYATLDLKEASDRVSYRFVLNVFRNSPAIRYFLLRRTDCTLLPNGTAMRLSKLSGMGSGLTFPIMSLLAHLSIVRSVVNSTGLRYELVKKHVYTYGDDVIVPARWYDAACKGLARAGLQVNLSKSFSRSHFRESCGGDYYNGHSVGPVRLRLANSAPVYFRKGHLLKLTSNPGIIQVERHCRELIRAGLASVAETFYKSIERKLKIKLPIGTGRTPYLCRYTLDGVAYPAVDGNYVQVRGVLPLPVVSKTPFMNPYYHLGNSLRPSGENSVLPWWDQIVSGCGSSFGEVSIPRQVRYKFGRISSFALMG